MDHKLFLDLETTGLEPTKDAILEVAMCVTDVNLKVIDKISIPIAYYGNVTDLMNDFVKNMHTKSGLLSDIDNYGLHLSSAEDILVEFFNKHFHKVQVVPMCGEGVHFDRAFLKQHMTKLHDLFHYRNIDTRTLITFFNDETEVPKPNVDNSVPHRALNDTIMAIDFYKHYSDIMQTTRFNK